MGEKDFKAEKELIELKHKYRMEELAFERENNKLNHDLQLEVIRIKSAEIRRSQQAKDFQKYSGGYK